MGVLLIVAAIVLATGVGIWSENRWPNGAAEAARKAMTLLLYTLLPLAYFFNLAAADLDLDHAFGLILALLAVSLSSGAAYLVADRVLKLPRHQVGAVVVTTMVVNTGYLGVPLSISLLGRDQLSTAVLFDVLVSGPMLLLGAFAVGAAMGTKSGESPRDRVRVFFTRNPPLYGAVLGLLAPHALAPDWIVHIAQGTVIAMLPIGFFAVGATLAEDAHEGTLPLPPPFTRPVALSLACRFVLAPALLLAFAAPLIDLPDTYRLLILMPTGLNAMVVSHAYGLDNRTVAECVTWSTAIVVVVALASTLF
jgi:predicted permease